MYSRKPQTILTSRKLNSVSSKAKAHESVREQSFTSPAENHFGTMYVNIGGVAMPIK